MPQPLRHYLTAAALSVALALYLTWPLATGLGSYLPLGTETSATVPLFNLWTQWWNARQWTELAASYWDAPIFHPTPGAFAFSEPQPLTGVVALGLTTLTGSPIVAANLVLLLALVANGLAGAWLTAALGLQRPAQLSAAAMVVALPFVHQELGVLQLTHVWGPLSVAAALVRLADRPTVLRGAVLGGAIAATYLSCATYALLSGLLMIPAGVASIVRGRRSRRCWLATAVAAAIAAVSVLPLARAQLRRLEEHGLERSVEVQQRNSARPSDYRRSAWPQLVPTPGIGSASDHAGRGFWPGSIKVTLAVAALLLAIRSREHRLPLASVALTVGVATALSLGPAGPGPGSPYGAVATTLPGFEQLRSPFRFAAFAQLGCAILAAAAIDAVVRRPSPVSTASSASVWWRPLAVVALTALAVLEVRPPRQPLTPLPPLTAKLPWIDWMLRSSAPDDAFAFLPFPVGSAVDAHESTGQWMYWQMRHGRPMVNGYSGFFPAGFRELADDLNRFPEPRSLARLRAHGVRFVVVERRFRSRVKVERASRLVARHLGAATRPRWVGSDDDAGLDVYELTPQATERGGGFVGP